MAVSSSQVRSTAAVMPPCSLGLSALVAGAAVFLTDMDLDLLGYALVGLAILLLLHAGLSTSCLDGPTPAGMTPSALKTPGQAR